MNYNPVLFEFQESLEVNYLWHWVKLTIFSDTQRLDLTVLLTTSECLQTLLNRLLDKLGLDNAIFKNFQYHLFLLPST